MNISMTNVEHGMKKSISFNNKNYSKEDVALIEGFLATSLEEGLRKNGCYSREEAEEKLWSGQWQYKLIEHQTRKIITRHLKRKGQTISKDNAELCLKTEKMFIEKEKDFLVSKIPSKSFLFCLEVLEGEYKGEKYEDIIVFPGHEIMVGRFEFPDKSDISLLRDSSVSEFHCYFKSEAVQCEGKHLLLLKDCGSTNNTFCNGTRYTDNQEFEVRFHDVITVGDTKMRVTRKEQF
eukprot:maker-scaffold_6-snap-gene-13.4-mRNA-1 protein AED:0.00 eAED:0.00 QI:66/1/1/1/0.66/0.5/4/793/234